MKTSLMETNWMAQTTVAAKVLTGQQLIDQGLSTPDKIEERIAQLKADLENSRVTPPEANADGVPKLAYELMDPASDKFIVMFDGQHRSESQQPSSQQLPRASRLIGC